MKIKELCEAKHFDDSQFVKHTDTGREIAYDVADDLVFFMNNDDAVYRKYTMPIIAACIKLLKAKKRANISVFKDSIVKSYNIYSKQYPIRELPNELDDDTIIDTAKLLYKEIKTDIQNGLYKDF
jgi:hypothetical protein